MKATKLTAFFAAMTYVILSFLIDQAYYSGDIEADSISGSLYSFIYLIICIAVFTVGLHSYQDFKVNAKGEASNVDVINKQLRFFSAIFSRVFVFIAVYFVGTLVLDIITQ